MQSVLALARLVLKCARIGLLVGATWACCAAEIAAQEQYPKPLVHTPENHPAQRVLLLDVQGLHAADLANWVSAHPGSALAELSSRGVTYTNAHIPWPDADAGLMAIATGGTPISTGIVSVDGYDHALSPPGSRCSIQGAALDIDRMLSANRGLDLANAPLDPKRDCIPLWPHNLMRVNTIFEVVHEKDGRTAWAGSDAGLTDLLSGPTGRGLDDACGFDNSSRPTLNASVAGDRGRVDAVLRWIAGKTCNGPEAAAVPVLFGMSFTALRVAQGDGGGYIDARGQPSPDVAAGVATVDAEIGRILVGLRGAKLYDGTWIFITSSRGGTPVEGRRSHVIPVAALAAAADSVKPGALVYVSGGRGAMIWLRDPALTDVVAKEYAKHADSLGIRSVDFGPRFGLTLNLPAQDSRMPDIVLEPNEGVVWGTATDSFAGMEDDGTHVALLVSGVQLGGRVDKTWVPTTQLPALLLRALGMEKFDLKALHEEHSPALPGIF